MRKFLMMPIKDGDSRYDYQNQYIIDEKELKNRLFDNHDNWCLEGFGDQIDRLTALIPEPEPEKDDRCACGEKLAPISICEKCVEVVEKKPEKEWPTEANIKKREYEAWVNDMPWVPDQDYFIDWLRRQPKR